MIVRPQEQCQSAESARRVKAPPGAPRIRDWYVERKAIVGQACDRLGIGNSSGNASEEPRVVGLAGPSGAGKSTVASMVVARADVRASFPKGVLWLQVGQGANDHLPELMIRLADMVYEIVMLKACRPPRKSGLKGEPEDGAAYIREVVNESSRRFVVVADDVWDVEVLHELKRAGMWVLYTSRDHSLLPDATPLRLDQLLKEEAELVLRRAADLDDDANLPAAAYELIELCEYGAMHLAFVGRWIHGRRDEQVWQAVLGRIRNAQKGDERGLGLSWRAAVLRAGLEELASDNPQNKELYLSLAVMPKGLAFPEEVAAVLLYGDDHTAQDLEAARGVAAILERWSILTVEDGGKYRVHDEHADFVKGRLSMNQDIRSKVLPRWRGYVSSVRALLTYTSIWLVEIWDVLARAQGEETPSRPYDAALDAMDPSSADRPTALRTAATFYMNRKDFSEAYNMFSELLIVEERWRLDVTWTLYDLAVCAGETGRTEEAEELFRRTLAIQEGELGVDHPDVAYTLHNLGVCLSSTGRTLEADELYRRALAIWEEKLGVDHPDVAYTLHNLTMEEAEEWNRRMLSIIRKSFLTAEYWVDSPCKISPCALGRPGSSFDDPLHLWWNTSYPGCALGTRTQQKHY